MLPTSKDEFIDVCKRNLGAPVIDININDDQVDDRVDEALKYFQKYHYNAVERFLMPHQITESNINDGYISVSSDILSITRIVHGGGGSGGGMSLAHTNWMSELGQSMRNIGWDIAFGGVGKCGSQGNISDYEYMVSQLQRLDFVFQGGAGYKQFEFNFRSHKLQIFTDWEGEFEVGDFIVCDTYQVIDPDTYGDVWSDEWLIEYGTALIGRQWGANLSKFSGVQLPGGIELDGDKIYDRYHERYLELREEIQLKFEYPPNFIIG